MSKIAPRFNLWLEFEQYEGGYPVHDDNPELDFCNVMLTLEDGSRYGLNVWTFGYLDWIKNHGDADESLLEPRKFVLTPDLLVARLERDLLETTFDQILRHGVPSEWQRNDMDED